MWYLCALGEFLPAYVDISVTLIRIWCSMARKLIDEWPWFTNYHANYESHFTHIQQDNDEAITFYILKIKGPLHYDVIIFSKSTFTGHYSRPSLKNRRGDCDRISHGFGYWTADTNLGCLPWNWWLSVSILCAAGLRMCVKHQHLTVCSHFLSCLRIHCLGRWIHLR